MNDEQNIAAVKMGFAAGGAVLYGLTLNEWVAIATFAYIIAQMALLVPKYVQAYRNWRKPPRNRRRSDRGQ